MATYSYTAKSFEGKTETGLLEALDVSHLAKDLRQQGLVLIQAESAEKPVRRFNFSFAVHVSLQEKIMIVRNLGAMFSAGVSLVKSFDILQAQSKKKALKKIFGDIREKINKGESFSTALSGYPHIFSELFVNMVKVGEESGTLDDIFQVLSLQLKKENELKSKIKNAMIYPSIILSVMALVGGVMVVFVLPSLKVFFSTLNAPIPLYTRLMLLLGDYAATYWYLFLLALICIPLLFIGILRTRRGKQVFDTITIKIPVLSSIVKKNNTAFLIRSLSSLIVAGVPLIRSLEIVSITVGSHYFKNALTVAAEKIKKGEKLSSALKPYRNIFPVGVIEMLEVGEETGKTSDILKKLADFYEQEAASDIEKLTLMIEPLLIIFLGIAVGIFAVSIIQPMYSSLKSVQ